MKFLRLRCSRRNVSISTALSPVTLYCVGGLTWPRNSIPRRMTNTPSGPAAAVRPTATPTRNWMRAWRAASPPLIPQARHSLRRPSRRLKRPAAKRSGTPDWIEQGLLSSRCCHADFDPRASSSFQSHFARSSGLPGQAWSSPAMTLCMAGGKAATVWSFGASFACPARAERCQCAGREARSKGWLAALQLALDYLHPQSSRVNPARHGGRPRLLAGAREKKERAHIRLVRTRRVE